MQFGTSVPNRELTVHGGAARVAWRFPGLGFALNSSLRSAGKPHFSARTQFQRQQAGI
jgi:hypothetical protein